MPTGSKVGPANGGKSLSDLGGVHILVVEDEYFIAQDLESALETAGAQVLGPVGDVGAALALLSSDQVDAAVLDINLHGIVDFGIAAELTRRNVPFVFATGYEPATIPRTYEHVPLWRKPFATDDLVAALEEMGWREAGVEVGRVE